MYYDYLFLQVFVHVYCSMSLEYPSLLLWSQNPTQILSIKLNHSFLWSLKTHSIWHLSFCLVMMVIHTHAYKHMRNGDCILITFDFPTAYLHNKYFVKGNACSVFVL